MNQQEQFLDVVDRDTAELRFRAALKLAPLGTEVLPLDEAQGRILADDVLARVDVPAFDRSNFDGFAVRASDTFGASELEPRTVWLLDETLEAGRQPTVEVRRGEAVQIATGGMLPRGADAVVMIEHADVRDGQVRIRRAAAPGTGVSFAGTDIAAGELVLPAGTALTSRETGVLAALGETHVSLWRRPRVAIISTGNEILAPGDAPRPACVFDSNSQVLADAVRELGAVPHRYGIVRDDVNALRRVLLAALSESDVVLLSGGTSKGQGDLCYRVVAELTDPGIVAHGVALKPGKPLCLAASAGKPIAVLPGFPTSAIFTFHEFLAPVIRALGGRHMAARDTVQARLAVKALSEVGRTEYLLVRLAQSDDGLTAFPLGQGSGSVTTFSRADGFVRIARHTELVPEGQEVEVQLIGRGLDVAELTIVGSHCVGLDCLLAQLQRRGTTTRLFNVGSSAGLAAVERGQCDLAGIHLLDAQSGQYNRPFLTGDLELIEGYRRCQGIVFRRGDTRFEGRSLAEIVERATTDTDCVMVNRNQGSGTRILIDRLLAGAQPPGYAVQPTNHNAVAAAIVQHRADWGLAIESVARAAGLGFLPYQDECYDFVVSASRRGRPAVQAFVALLADEAIRHRLAAMGLRPAGKS